MFHGHQIRAVVHGRRARKRQRTGLDAPVDRPPHVDDAVPALQEMLRVFGGRGVQFYARESRRRSLVDVRACDGGAGRGGRGASDRVVEDCDFVGAGQVGEEEGGYLGVVG